MSLISDEHIRLQALNPQKSFIVQAPAGSGKTELLIQRYLKLLCQVQQPEEILAITFTRKAALEMKNRILEALHDAQNADQQEKLQPHAALTRKMALDVLHRDQKFKWNLLKENARLKLQTFDAFCSELVFKCPLKSRMSRHRKILEDPDLFFQNVVRDFLKEAIEQPWRAAVENFLYQLQNNWVLAEKLLCQMLTLREQWLPYWVPLASQGEFDALRSQLETGWRSLNQSFLKRFECEWQKWAPVANPIIAFAQNSYLPLQNLDLNSRTGCQNLAQWLLTQDEQLRRSWTLKQGFPAPSSSKNKQEKALWQDLKNQVIGWSEQLQTAEGAPFFALLKEALHLPEEGYSESEWISLTALFEILPMLVAYLELHFQKNNQTDFSALSQGALLSLGTAEEPTDLTLFLDAQIKHILIDEFQDTNIAQFHLIEKMLQGWVGDLQRTLFLVGDPMQSIYRFRHAEVNLFLKVKEQGIASVSCTPLILKANFRTRPPILKWINERFADIFPQISNANVGAIAYESSLASRSEAPDTGVELFHFEMPEQEIDQILQIITQEKTNHPDHTIAVLVKTRSQAAPIIQALQSTGISYHAVGLDALADKTVVSDLLALLKALLQPWDRISWLTVLRAPWAGILIQDLDVLIQTHFSWPIPRLLFALLKTPHVQLSPDGLRRLNVLACIFEKAQHTYPMRQSLRIWLESVWTELKAPDFLSPEERIYAQDFFRLLESQTQPGILIDWEQFISVLERHPAENTAHEPQAVQILTVHKSKGLEFETVILPQLNRSSRHPEPRLLMWKECWFKNDFSLLLAPFGKKNTSLKWTFLNQMENEQLEQEQRRLLYVAATRAREKLYLLASGTENARLNFWSYLKTDPRVLRKSGSYPQPAFNENDELEHQGVGSNFTPLRRLPSEAFSNELPERSLKKKWDTSKTSEHLDLKTQYAQELGQCIHRILEYWVRFESEVWTPRQLDQSASWLQRLMAFYPTLNQEPQKTQSELNQILKNVLTDPMGRFVLDPSHENSAAELNVFFEGNSYVIDRTFTDSKGIRWIIDYKTTDRLSEPDWDQIQQMKKYKSCLEALGEKNIQLAIYFLRIPKWVQLDTRSLLPLQSKSESINSLQ